jgi:hypothetical protein
MCWFGIEWPIISVKTECYHTVGWVFLSSSHWSHSPVLSTVVSLLFAHHHQFLPPRCCFSAGNKSSNIWQGMDLKLTMRKQQRKMICKDRTVRSMDRRQKYFPQYGLTLHGWLCIKIVYELYSICLLNLLCATPHLHNHNIKMDWFYRINR